MARANKPDRAEGGIDPGSVFAASPPSVTYGDQGRATGLARPSDPAARGEIGRRPNQLRSLRVAVLPSPRRPAPG